jgi:hypothetical protein
MEGDADKYVVVDVEGVADALGVAEIDCVAKMDGNADREVVVDVEGVTYELGAAKVDGVV